MRAGKGPPSAAIAGGGGPITAYLKERAVSPLEAVDDASQGLKNSPESADRRDWERDAWMDNRVMVGWGEG